MTRIEIQHVDIPSEANAGESFEVTGVVDNMENLAPLLGGNCRNGARQGEKVDISLTVEDKSGSEVVTAKDQVCAGYGFDAQDQPFSFDVNIQYAGEYRILVEAETTRERGSDDNDKHGPVVVDVVGDGNGGGGGGPPEKPLEIMSAQLTAPNTVNEIQSKEVRVEAVVQNNTYTTQQAAFGLKLWNTNIGSAMADIAPNGMSTVEVKTTLTASEVGTLVRDGEMNPVKLKMGEEEVEAGIFTSNLPDEEPPDNGNGGNGGNGNGGNGGNGGDGDKDSGGIISWANENPLISGGILIGGTVGARQYLKSKNDGGS